MNMLGKSAILAILLTFHTTAASAYQFAMCQGAPLKLPTNNHTLYHNINSFPEGGYQTAIENAVAKFNDHPSGFYYSSSSTISNELGNGFSEAWGSTDASVLKGSPAIAYMYSDCYYQADGTLVSQMKEGDIIFDYNNASNDKWLWTYNETKSDNLSYAGKKRLIQATAIHEMGHAVGLNHEAYRYNVMGADYSHLSTNGPNALAYVGVDTGSGLRALYGEWELGHEDLGVAHWYRSGASGEYSSHSRTRIFSRSGKELTKSVIDGEPVYEVSRGNKVRVEFNFENLGKSAHVGVPVKFYISNDETITEADTEIGSAAVDFAVGELTLRGSQVRIPRTGVTRGSTYWLGVIVNPGGTSVSEFNLNNNKSYSRIKVK